MASLTKGLRLPFGACICLVLPVFFALLIGITGDVPDDVVHTDIQRTVQLGDRAILKCQFYGTPLAVFWKKGSDPTTAPNLITWVEGENDSGSCVHDKTCKMNGDYSLIIKNVTLADQGRYICRVSNYKGYLIHGYTDFKVYVVPVGVCVVGVCCLIMLVKILCKKCRARENGTDGKGKCKPLLEAKEGTISHYELWFLAGKMTESQADKNMLRNTFRELDITADIRDGQLTPEEAYQALCEWKQENRDVDQAQVLKEALTNFHYDDVWTKLLDEKINLKKEVSQETMEHILWKIGGIKKVNQFLRQLIPDRKPISDNEKMVCVVEEAVNAMNKWSQESLELNPVILMSLALEDAGCTSIKRLFFSIPDELMKPIPDKKQIDFTDKLTGRHCKRLAMTLKPSEQRIHDYIPKNNHYVFNTRLLITEWLLEEECSNYEKRCRLDDAVIKIGRYDLQDFFKTLGDRPNAEQRHVKSYYFDHESIFDDDIPQLVKLVKWLPPSKQTQLKMKIGLPEGKHDNDDVVEDRMKAWRDRITSTSTENNVSRDQALAEFQSLRKELTNNTTYTELTLTDGEIEAVSSHVISTGKQQELTSRLHIDAVHGQKDSFVGQLKQWRNTQAKKNCRETLQKALDEIGLAEPTLTDEEIETVSSRVTSTGKQQELISRLHIGAVHEQNDSFVGQLKQWRNTQTKTNCRKTLQKALEQIGLAGCLESIMGKGTTKQLDQDELHRIALDLMKEDVHPLTDVLGIDRDKVKTYDRECNDQDNCTTGLLVNLKKESRNREVFCKALRNVGFIDIARSVFYGEKVSVTPQKP